MLIVDTVFLLINPSLFCAFVERGLCLFVGLPLSSPRWKTYLTDTRRKHGARGEQKIASSSTQSFWVHGRKPEVNISAARTVISPRLIIVSVSEKMLNNINIVVWRTTRIGKQLTPGCRPWLKNVKRLIRANFRCALQALQISRDGHISLAVLFYSPKLGTDRSLI